MTDTQSTQVNRRDIGLRSARGPVLIAVMLSTALVALDQTIVSTAVPSIVRDLGGFREFPWLFSVYLLAQAATVPVYGKLADQFGRKPLMYYGIGVFLLGSVLCAVAWSMPVLIVARGLQGLGAGAVQPIGMTIIGDIYTLRERAKVQGYVASVWGISSVIGPTFGGVFSQLLSWRFIFWVNVPLCLLAAFMLRRFTEKVERGHVKVDYVGRRACSRSATTLVVLGPAGGRPLLGLDRLADPGDLRGRRADPGGLRARRAGGGAAGAAAVGVRQPHAADHQRPLAAGRRADPGPVVVRADPRPGRDRRLGHRERLRARRADPRLAGGRGAVRAAVPQHRLPGDRPARRRPGRRRLLVLALMDPAGSLWHVALGCLLIGFGMGWVAAPALVVAQSSVAWGERGVATATNMFSRSVGSAIGVAVFGAMVNAVAGDHPTAATLATGVHRVFVGILVLALAMGVLELFMPKRVSPPA